MDPGWTATGGGFSVTSGGLEVLESVPTNDGTQSWEVQVYNATAIGGQFVAEVVCVSP